MIARGYILTRFWVWFVVPVFALAPLGLGQAVGLSLFVAFFKTIKTSGKPERELTLDEKWTGLIQMYILDGLMLLAGWFVAWCIR